jgi:hypothetical protein
VIKSIELVAITLAFVALTGCKQGEGEPCEQEDECGEGLSCQCVDLPDVRGQCLPEDEEPACSDVDAGPQPDAGREPDAGRVDAGRVDAGSDAGMSIDAGMSMTDAGSDAGPIMTDAGNDAGMIDAGPVP